MTKKKDIDKKREAAFHINVGDENDGNTRIPMPIGDSLYLLSENSIYLISLADQIDPERTNIDLPNAQKKILPHGLNDPIVRQVLLTARAFFDKRHLAKELDTLEALKKSFDATKLLTEMRDLHAGLKLKVDSLTEKPIVVGKDGSVKIPSIHDLETQILSYTKKADQIRDIIFGYLELMYQPPKGKRTIENIKALIVEKHGENHPLSELVSGIQTTLSFIRNIRNAIEHPKAHEKFSILDFQMAPDRSIDPPTIELVHPQMHQPRTDALNFMSELIKWFSEILEQLILALCHAYIRESAGFPLGIMELPENRRRIDKARFTYAIFINGTWQPLG